MTVAWEKALYGLTLAAVAALTDPGCDLPYRGNVALAEAFRDRLEVLCSFVTAAGWSTHPLFALEHGV